jgi:hypothetical protein
LVIPACGRQGNLFGIWCLTGWVFQIPQSEIRNPKSFKGFTLAQVATIIPIGGMGSSILLTFPRKSGLNFTLNILTR